MAPLSSLWLILFELRIVVICKTNIMAKQEECEKCERAKQSSYASEMKCSFYGRKPKFDGKSCPRFPRCPECGQETPSTASVCPNCGCPLKSNISEKSTSNSTKKTNHKDLYEILQILVISVFVMVPVYYFSTKATTLTTEWISFCKNHPSAESIYHKFESITPANSISIYQELVKTLANNEKNSGEKCDAFYYMFTLLTFDIDSHHDKDSDGKYSDDDVARFNEITESQDFIMATAHSGGGKDIRDDLQTFAKLSGSNILQTEQKGLEQERAKNLITTPPKSVSDLRDRIIGTRWKVEHSDYIYPIYEFDGSKVREYLVRGGDKSLNNENSYTIREDAKSDCYLIEFGDNYEMLNLKKIIMFVKGTNAVVLYEPMTGSRDNLQLLN